MTARATAPALQLDRVSKRFGAVVAVDDVSLDIREGEFFSLLGPSGCGKTTTLRMLAGFEDPDAGAIRLRGEDVTFVPPNRRNVNMVFQAYELFPHMTVFDNVAYGLRLRRVRRPELTDRVRQMLRVVRVEALEGRGARQLSGGQQQRVALARALVNRPAVLLLDEPLSALDVKLRKQMQQELKAIQHQLGTTFVYVTHDQEEALLLSDRVGIMDGGRLLQVGSPREIYEQPAHRFVADFVGSLNVLELVVESSSEGIARACPSPTEQVAVRSDARPGDRIRLAIRPERIDVLARPAEVAVADGRSSRLDAAVAGVDYVGSLTHYRVATGAFGELVCHVVNHGASPDLRVGDRVVLAWTVDAGFVLPDA